MMETPAAAIMTATARATVTSTAMARAAMIRTTTRMMIATDQDDGNG